MEQEITGQKFKSGPNGINKILILVFIGAMAFSFFFTYFPFFYAKVQPVFALTSAETSMKNKTATFYIMQDKTVLTSGVSTSTDFIVFIGETNPVATSSYIEISGVTKAVGAQNITVDIRRDGDSAFPTSRQRTFVVNSSGVDMPFTIFYNGNDEAGANDLNTYLKEVLTSAGSYTFSLKVDISGASVSVLGAKLVLTYGYTPPSGGTTIPNSNTTVFTVLQNQEVLSNGNSTTTDFSFLVGEPSPVIKNAFIEMSGVTKAAGSQNITMDIKRASDSFPTARTRTFVIDSTGVDTPFTIYYYGNDEGAANNLTAYFSGIITDPTEYIFNVKVDISGAAVSLLGARLILTYEFSQAGGLPATGDLISSTFDTYTVNGANFNWIKWKGIEPAGTQVRLQFATSNNSSGPFNFIGPAPSCNSSAWYIPDSDQSVEIGCPGTHNNKRYYRYKVQICSDSDCSTSGSQTPEVQDVIINWSP